MAAIPAPLLRLFAPIESLLTDPSVRRVLVDGPDRVFVERHGRVERVRLRYGAKALGDSLDGLARRARKPFDDQRPTFEALLKDGTRFLALRAPAVSGGPVLAITRPGGRTIDLPAMVRSGILNPDVRRLLVTAITGGANIAVVGPPGSGRTTMVEALASAIPLTARVVVVEEFPELRLPDRPVVRLTPRRAEGEKGVSTGELLYCAGRMAVDRVILAEVKRSDAWEAVSMMADRMAPVLVVLPGMTGADALARLDALARSVAAGPRERAVPGLLAAGLDLVITLGRRAGRHIVAAIEAVEVTPEGLALTPAYLYEGGAHGTLAAREAALRLAMRWGVPPPAPHERAEALARPVARPAAVEPPPVEAPPERASERSLPGLGPRDRVSVSVRPSEPLDRSGSSSGNRPPVPAVEDGASGSSSSASAVGAAPEASSEGPARSVVTLGDDDVVGPDTQIAVVPEQPRPPERSIGPHPVESLEGTRPIPRPAPEEVRTMVTEAIDGVAEAVEAASAPSMPGAPSLNGGETRSADLDDSVLDDSVLDDSVLDERIPEDIRIHGSTSGGERSLPGGSLSLSDGETSRMPAAEPAPDLSLSGVDASMASSVGLSSDASAPGPGRVRPRKTFSEVIRGLGAADDSESSSMWPQVETEASDRQEPPSQRPPRATPVKAAEPGAELSDEDETGSIGEIDLEELGRPPAWGRGSNRQD